RREGWPRESRGYALSGGLLRCGRCGAPMHGMTRVTTYKGRRSEYRVYICDGYKTTVGKCRAYSVAENKILPTLLRVVNEHYLAPGRLDDLERSILARARSRKRADPARLAELRGRLKLRDEEVRCAAQNVLRCRDNVDVLNGELTRLRQERDAVAEEL